LAFLIFRGDYRYFPFKPFENASAEGRLAVILREVTDFFAQNAEISKIAILDNLENDDGAPHLFSDVEVINGCLKELCNDDIQRIWIKNYIIAGFLNYIFLKANIIKMETAFDFYDKPQRDQVVDKFIRDLFHL
jgi:hypothetical protein